MCLGELSRVIWNHLYRWIDARIRFSVALNSDAIRFASHIDVQSISFPFHLDSFCTDNSMNSMRQIFHAINCVDGASLIAWYDCQFQNGKKIFKFSDAILSTSVSSIWSPIWCDDIWAILSTARQEMCMYLCICMEWNREKLKKFSFLPSPRFLVLHVGLSARRCTRSRTNDGWERMRKNERWREGEKGREGWGGRRNTDR